MRLTIIASPDPATGHVVGQHVRIINADTREPLEGVMSVTWHCEGRGEPAICVLKLRDVAIDTVVELPAHAAAAILLARD